MICRGFILVYGRHVLPPCSICLHFLCSGIFCRKSYQGWYYSPGLFRNVQIKKQWEEIAAKLKYITFILFRQRKGWIGEITSYNLKNIFGNVTKTKISLFNVPKSFDWKTAQWIEHKFGSSLKSHCIHYSFGFQYIRWRHLPLEASSWWYMILWWDRYKNCPEN